MSRSRRPPARLTRWDVTCPKCDAHYEFFGTGRWIPAAIVRGQAFRGHTTSRYWDSRRGPQTHERPERVFRTVRKVEVCASCLELEAVKYEAEVRREWRENGVRQVIEHLRGEPITWFNGFHQCPACFRLFEATRKDKRTCGRSACREKVRYWLAMYERTGTLSDVVLKHMQEEREAALKEWIPSGEGEGSWVLRHARD